jgi:hypothetical protein
MAATHDSSTAVSLARAQRDGWLGLTVSLRMCIAVVGSRAKRFSTTRQALLVLRSTEVYSAGANRLKTVRDSKIN